MDTRFSLGRIEPSDWIHVDRYPFSAVAPPTVQCVERTLRLPAYRGTYNQGGTNACVGFASSWMMSILNRRLYDACWLWRSAKQIDEWDFTQPDDNNGTSVRAAMDVLRKTGHRQILRGRSKDPSLAEGIIENRWALSVDEIRTCISIGVPVTLGINWYAAFDDPIQQGRNWWIGQDDWGARRGGHAVCIYRASDRLQAVGIVNSWGLSYPRVLLSYAALTRLLNEYGEATLVTDYPG